MATRAEKRVDYVRAGDRETAVQKSVYYLMRHRKSLFSFIAYYIFMEEKRKQDLDPISPFPLTKRCTGRG